MDIATVGAVIAYGYTSFCTFRVARKEQAKLYMVTGALGILFSLLFSLFLLLPKLFGVGSLATESYLILVVWSVIGFLFFLYTYRHDKQEHFGHSIVVWGVLLFLTFFSSLMWLRETTEQTTEKIVNNVGAFYTRELADFNIYMNGLRKEQEAAYVKQQIDVLHSSLTEHTLVQIFLIVMSVGAIFFSYASMGEKKRKLEVEKIKIEEISKAKTSFLSNMSHDIRTPLNAIIGFTNLALGKKVEEFEEVCEYLKKIQLSSNHLLSLINDVLEMSRIESGKTELHERLLSVPDMLHELAGIVLGQAEAKQHSLNFTALYVKNEKIYCDKLRLNQLLLNILSNAIKYTPSGGVISVSVEQLSASEGYGVYEFRVKDNGIGMSAEFAKKIFGAFERENTEPVHGIQGTGLGMAIVKHIVDLMHGTIRVESKPEEGSEFIVTLRFKLANDEEKQSCELALTRLHALIIDDDFSVCDSVTTMLQELGIRSEWTLSGREALLRIKKSIEFRDEFSLFFVDLRLPDLSGLEVTREIRNMLQDRAFVILMTAYDWQMIRDEAREAGVNEFCNKPIFASELHQSILSATGAKVESPHTETARFSDADFLGKRLLLVDDVDVNREVAQTVLTMSGFDVAEAVDGSDAFEKVKSNPPDYFDAILMDIQMPKVNGYEATRMIRALPADRGAIPIIAMTANAFDEDRRAAFNAGMNAHIAKPIDVPVLLETLRRVLRKA